MCCAFWLHMFNFFFYEKSCMNGEKNLYTVSVKLSYLFQFLAHTPYNQNEIWSMAVFRHLRVKSLLLWFEGPHPFFQSEHYRIAFLLRILSNHMWPWINSTTFLLKNQSQFDLGVFPFPNEIEMQYLFSLVFVDIALCIPFKTLI